MLTNPILSNKIEPRISFELEVERKRQSGPWYSRKDFYPWQYEKALDARAKGDGSLRNGREFSSLTPRTLADWRTWNLTDVLEQLQEVTSADRTSTAGLHMHIDRAAFSASGLARLFTIVNHDDGVLRKLSRRRTFRYCAFHSNSEEYWTKLAEDGLRPTASRKIYHHKYQAVYCHPTYPTVELRFFRSTIIPQRFYAALETAHALWLYAECYQDLPATGQDWAAFVQKHPNYTLLREELRAQRAVGVTRKRKAAAV